jgi:predicted transcriptional regulator
MRKGPVLGFCAMSLLEQIYRWLKEFQEMVLLVKFVIDGTIVHCDGLLWVLKIVVVAQIVSFSISGPGKNSG